MNETEGKHGLTWPMVLGVLFAAPFLLGFAMIGAERIYVLLKIFVWGAVVTGGMMGLGVIVRQWRRGEEKPETVREVVRDGTQRVKEIHYGTPPKYQLGDTVADPFAFPAMARAAFAAGADTTGRQTSYAPMVARPDYDELPPEATDGDDVPPPMGWNGEIVM